MQTRIAHPLAGEVRAVANPMRFSETPIAYDVPPPVLGEHTEEVLRTVAGIEPPELARLRERGVV